ncbi:hypothetical protein HPP92_019643 [Vanilla planifolia]|uniref:FCP1 homology domain-containing protein n=1 Tax=Vanilla planifolia TaxID=51239 RepID=A0A835Q9D6_VANPL|nr:hypothetical protein HPP92_019643 [Vanilla planifolia]
MVSKINRKAPTKTTKPSPKTGRRGRLKSSPSPVKSISAYASSVDRSIRRCLLKFFTCLAVINTPKRRKKGFRRLPRPHDGETASTQPGRPRRDALPPPSVPGRITIVLDLDETLVHSRVGVPPDRYDFVVHPSIEGLEMTFYVLKRPGVDELLHAASESFEVVIYTAGLKEYASLVIDQLDPGGGMVTHRLYRDSCLEEEGGKMVKDLSSLGRNLDRVVIVDDNPVSYSLQKENAIPVASFVDDPRDKELVRLMQFFDVAHRFEDMREAVAFYLSEQIKE